MIALKKKTGVMRDRYHLCHPDHALDAFFRLAKYFNIKMKENHSENLERDFFSFFYSALFSYLFFHSTLLVKEICHGLAAVNHKDGHDSPK